jgi:uncharacterized protein (TIGR01319 family)
MGAITIKEKEKIKSILATDCGSTTTKAILIEEENGHYRLKVRGEAPTTVESPFDDVTIGVINATNEVEELVKRKIIFNNEIKRPYEKGEGVDIYLSTSSAGGGLQMMVAGVVSKMTTESAQRAALGAGAIVMDAIALDDGRKPHERISRIRGLRPDIMLLAGGIDGGTKTHVVELAELILSADPKPRFGTDFRLPVIYAGNKDVREEIKKLMGERTALQIVDNIRPVLEKENLQPAREAIHEVFLHHVMAHAPGYDKLMKWVDANILATPHAVGLIMQEIARTYNINLLGVDIGGATTDVFSVINGIFNRTVSANLGLSYSIGNVLLEAGLDNIARWVPIKINKQEIKDRLRNKMIRPTTIPQTMEDLLVEQAVAREALRLAFEHHKSLAVGLKGIHQERTIADAFTQKTTGETLIKMMDLDIIVGSGGVLSHAPERAQAAFMMLDAYQPEGITILAVDSIFMMPHLGVLSTVFPEAATEVFEKDCMIYLGTSICPVGVAKKENEEIAKVIIRGKEETIIAGEIKVIPLGVNEEIEVEIIPTKKFNVGTGFGKKVIKKVKGGVVGLILDGRGRPLQLPQNDEIRQEKLTKWYNAFNIKV